MRGHPGIAEFRLPAADSLQHLASTAAYRAFLPFDHAGAAAYSAQILAYAGRIGRPFIARIQRRVLILPRRRSGRLHSTPPFAFPTSLRARIMRARNDDTRAMSGPRVEAHRTGAPTTMTRRPA
ncbi:hypothetical protein KDW69_31550 [Burkholderia ambifaria]|nr:hypothetical protein [Burkholderia ambifaria]